MPTLKTKIKEFILKPFSVLSIRIRGRNYLGLQIFVLVILGFYTSVGLYWSIEPKLFDIARVNHSPAGLKKTEPVTGSATVSATIAIAETMLLKPGGYLYNDLFPPGLVMDNIPNWELGVLVQVRDMIRTLRNNMSRSQSQSTENLNLVNAEGLFYFDNKSWILPSTENEYQKGIGALKIYLSDLRNPDRQNAQFYSRADNLTIWLSEVETRLGSLSQRLSTSVGKRQLDVSLAGDASARKSTTASIEKTLKTPWLKIDDIFFEARGTTWALIHLLKAIEIDFSEVLLKKNALVSLQQIIRELEPTQDALWSPMILNGSGLGFLANHSLVMGSHISRANAAIIDLRRLLEDG